jgi:galactokinase
MNLTEHLTETFKQHFGHAPELEAFAPGRVNLIGEHTDYNNGLVLPTAIPQTTRIALSKRTDDLARVHAVQMNQSLEYHVGHESRTQGWLDYVQGVSWVLTQEGHKLGGFDAVIDSDVPLGSGLSSSAALLVATMKGLRALFELKLDDVTIARLSQRAENDFCGARVGLMDQMACALAVQGEALFIDFKTMDYQRVPLPTSAELVVLHSGVAHANTSDHGTRNYKTRRAECEHACKLLSVKSLSDLSPDDLSRLEMLPEPYRSRARHVIMENARVRETVKAFQDNDLERVGQLFYASHASMRDDYDTSEPEIDLIVELAHSRSEIYGARLTGGGFGGSVVMLARSGQGRAVGEFIAAEYAQRSGRTPKLLTPSQ